MQKKTLLVGIGVALAVIVLVVVALLAGVGFFLNKALSEQGQRPDGAGPVAVLRVERGSATVASGAVSQQVSGETELLTGDEVTVSDDGRAAIYWDGYGRTLIDAGTKLRVSEAERPAGEKSLRARILIDIGRTWTRLEQVLELGSEVSVGASNVVATVRGTSFGVERQGNTVAVKVKESKVEASRVGSEEAQTVEAGSKIEAQEGSTDALRAPVRMTDAEQNDPFAVAGHMPVEAGLYDLSGWTSSAEQWVQKGIEYLAWHPWQLVRINFGGGGTFREWYSMVPSDIRRDLESQIGAPDEAEIGRLLSW